MSLKTSHLESITITGVYMIKLKLTISDFGTRCGQTLSRAGDSISIMLKSAATIVSTTSIAEDTQINLSSKITQRLFAANSFSKIGGNRMISFKNAASRLAAKSCKMFLHVQVALSSLTASMKTILVRLSSRAARTTLVVGGIITGIVIVPSSMAYAQGTVNSNVTLTTQYSSIVPGGVMEFTLTAEPPPATGTIDVVVSPTDGEPDDDEIIILPGTSFSIGTSGTATGYVFGRAGNSNTDMLTLSFFVLDLNHTKGPDLTVNFQTPTTPAEISISGPTSPVDEDSESVTFTITADPPADKDIAVKVNVADLAGRSSNYVDEGDYYVRIPATATSATLPVPINDVSGAGLDGVIQAMVQCVDETTRQCAGYNHSVGTNTAFVDVYDTDGTTPVVTVAANPTSVVVGQDGTATATFTFTRTGSTTNSLNFSYELIETGEVTTETAGNVDSVSFGTGDRRKEITVPITATNLNAGDGVELRLRSAREFPTATYRVGLQGQAKVDVRSRQPNLSITNTRFYVAEDVGVNGYNLELELSAAPLQNVTLDFAVTAGNAVADTDYVISEQSKSVVFSASASETRKTIPISIVDNADNDQNKTIRFTLSNLVGAEFAAGGISLTRTIVIVDDEAATFSMSTTDFRVNENVGAGKFDVNFTLTPASQYDVTYTVFTEGDTAENVHDYLELTRQTVTIPAGEYNEFCFNSNHQ